MIMTVTVIMIMGMGMRMIMNNETITQTFYGQWSSLVFLIYTGFTCTYKTFVIPLENCNIVSFDCSRM